MYMDEKQIFAALQHNNYIGIASILCKRKIYILYGTKTITKKVERYVLLQRNLGENDNTIAMYIDKNQMSISI
jgi:hypothetical protein